MIEQQEPNIPQSQDPNIIPNNTEPIEARPKKFVNIFGLNLIIFFAYYLLFRNWIDAGFLGELVGMNSDVFIFLYIPHAAILLILSIIYGIIGYSKKKRTNALKYFLTSILMLIIGTGVCFSDLARLFGKGF